MSAPHMGHIIVETLIHAPRERVFDLARDVGAHNRSASFTDERCVAPGRTDGLLELGDLVTFEGVHFGIRQRFTAELGITSRTRKHSDVGDELDPVLAQQGNEIVDLARGMPNRPDASDQ